MNDLRLGTMEQYYTLLRLKMLPLEVFYCMRALSTMNINRCKAHPLTLPVGAMIIQCYTQEQAGDQSRNWRVYAEFSDGHQDPKVCCSGQSLIRRESPGTFLIIPRPMYNVLVVVKVMKP